MAGSENRTIGGVRPCGIPFDTKITPHLPPGEQRECVWVEVSRYRGGTETVKVMLAMVLVGSPAWAQARSINFNPWELVYPVDWENFRTGDVIEFTSYMYRSEPV